MLTTHPLRQKETLEGTTKLDTPVPSEIYPRRSKYCASLAVSHESTLLPSITCFCSAFTDLQTVLPNIHMASPSGDELAVVVVSPDPRVYFV